MGRESGVTADPPGRCQRSGMDRSSTEPPRPSPGRATRTRTRGRSAGVAGSPFGEARRPAGTCPPGRSVRGRHLRRTLRSPSATAGTAHGRADGVHAAIRHRSPDVLIELCYRVRRDSACASMSAWTSPSRETSIRTSGPSCSAGEKGRTAAATQRRLGASVARRRPMQQRQRLRRRLRRRTARHPLEPAAVPLHDRCRHRSDPAPVGALG